MGSAANNMCMVARGQVDAYAEFGMHCWDIAAGYLIVLEAGGVVMATEGKRIAGTGHLISVSGGKWGWQSPIKFLPVWGDNLL